VPLVDDAEEAEVVVVGWDRDLTYAKLLAAHQAIVAGARFVATNPDTSYPLSGGKTGPGAGATVTALAASTGVAPTVFGKPEPTGMAMIAAAWGVAPEEIAAVGDRLDTDIVAAKRFGCRSILVLTGLTSRERAEAAKGLEVADVVIDDLSGLWGALA
jgi:4-nitrophenyl phosphatase